MRKKFAINLAFIFVANLLVKPFWIFGIDRVVQNKFGPEVYGTYFAVFNYSFLLSIILDFGINNFNNRAVSRNHKRLGEYLLNLLTVKTVLAVIYFVFTLLWALYIGYKEQQITMLVFLAINQILLSIILYFRSNIAALQLFKTDSIISVLDRLFVIIFCMVLMYLPVFKDSFSIMWFIYAQTAGLFITALIAFGVIMSRGKLQFALWKPRFTSMILLKSMPFAMLALLMGIYYRIDAVMIERMLPNGATEAGIYAASFRLLDAVNMFGYLFATLLLPMFAGMIRRNEMTRSLVKFSSELMFAFAVIVSLDCYFFRNEIMQLLYHNSTPYWSKIFGWLMVNFIPMSSIYIFGTLLTARGNLKVLNIIAIGGVVVNVGLNLYMIPHYGALGATVATVITQFAAAGAHIIATNRQFGFSYDVKDALRISTFTLLSLATLFLIKMFALPWMLSLAIATAICALIASVIKLVPFSEVLSLLRSRAT